MHTTSRGLSKQQDAVLAYLRTVPPSTTQEIAEAVLADRIRELRGNYWYNFDVRQTLLRSLHSLERRGLVVGNLTRGEDVKWTGTSGDKHSIPTRELVWEIVPSGSTPTDAAQKVKADKVIVWFNRVKKYALMVADQSKLGPGEDCVVHEDQGITIDLCNYTDHERLLNVDERNREHSFVAGIDCNLQEVGYFRKSGHTASEAMQAALEELGRKLQLHPWGTREQHLR
jgi:hypothetical protein